MTDKGNSIVVIGKEESPEVVFLDITGNIRRTIDVKKSGMGFYMITPDGKAVLMGSRSEKANKLSLMYLDEEGTRQWRKEIRVNDPWVEISENGDSISIQEANPKWSEEEWEAGDVNVAAVHLLNRLGEEVLRTMLAVFHFRSGFHLQNTGDWSGVKKRGMKRGSQRFIVWLLSSRCGSVRWPLLLGNGIGLP